MNQLDEVINSRMTTIEQTLYHNTDDNDKKIYFDDISPIKECLDGCDRCTGYYISYELEAYSICECPHHNNTLTIDDIKPKILSFQNNKRCKECDNDHGKIGTRKHPHAIHELLSSLFLTRCTF